MSGHEPSGATARLRKKPRIAALLLAVLAAPGFAMPVTIAPKDCAQLYLLNH